MSFDHLAPHYRWMEHVLAGDVLQRARVAHLRAIDQAKNVLLVGEGPGQFLSALRRRRPNVPVTVVDSSKAMLREAKRRVPPGPTKWVQADLKSWQPPAARWDALVSHCVLDCFEADTLAKILPRLAIGLTDQADWLITDFAIPAQGWQRSRAKIVHALMYGVFRRTTEVDARARVDPSPWLREAGFRLRERREFSQHLIHADHWQRS